MTSFSSATTIPRPTTVEAAVAALLAAQSRFEELAEDMRAIPSQAPGILDQLRAPCLSQWSFMPATDLPQASRDDLLGLAICALRHALMVHPACAAHATIQRTLALPEGSDPLAPLLHVLMRLPCAQAEDALIDAVHANRPLLRLVGAVLAVQEEPQFRQHLDRFLSDLGQPGSPYAMPATTRPPVIPLGARLAICNVLVRTPGLSDARRARVVSTLTRGSVSPHLALRPANDTPRSCLRPTG